MTVSLGAMPASPVPRLAQRLADLPPVAPPQQPRTTPLRSAHLRLQPLEPGDAAVLAGHFGEPGVRLHLFDGAAVDTAWVAGWIDWSLAAAAQRRGGAWLARRLADGRLVGTAALLAWPAQAAGELVLSLAPDSTGQGLATEIGQRVLRHAFDDLRLDLVRADSNPPNPRTAGLARRLGMRVERRAGAGHGACFFVIDRKMHRAGRALPAAGGVPAARTSHT